MGLGKYYIPRPEYPEYLPPTDDVLPAEEQPLPTAVSPTAESLGYITESEPEMELEEEDGDDEKSEEDSIEYPTSGGDDDADDDNDDLSEDDADDEDEEESSNSEEEEEEHLAPTVPAPALYSSVSASEETEPFEEGETAATPPPFGYRVAARISVQPHILTPFRSESEIERLLAIPAPPLSPISPTSYPLPPFLIPLPIHYLLHHFHYLCRYRLLLVGESSVAAAARQIRPALTIADRHRADDRLIGKLRRERRYFRTLSTTYAQEVAHSRDYCTQIMDYCQSREVHTSTLVTQIEALQRDVSTLQRQHIDDEDKLMRHIQHEHAQRDVAPEDGDIMSSDSHATITYTLMSSYEVIVNGYYRMPMDPLDPYVQLVMEAPPSPYYIPRPEAPPSPDYIPGPKAPPSPDYIPRPEYPEYLPPADDVLPAEEQPLPATVSPTAESPGYITVSEPEMELEEEDGDDEKYKEDSIEYPTSGGDDDADDVGDDLSEDDADDEDEEESSDSEEEEEEHLALIVPALALHSSIPAFEDSDETEPFEEGEIATTPPPFGYRIAARISVQPHILIPFRSESEVERLLSIPTPPL
nr:hypothetical protein [Tanacetum cinerariifolium]